MGDKPFGVSPAFWDSADVECPRCKQWVRPYYDNGTWRGVRRSHLPGWRLPMHNVADDSDQCPGSLMLRREDWAAGEV